MTKRRVNSVRIQISLTPKEFLQVLDDYVEEQRKQRVYDRSKAILDGLKLLIPDWERRLKEVQYKALDLTR